MISEDHERRAMEVLDLVGAERLERLERVGQRAIPERPPFLRECSASRAAAAFTLCPTAGHRLGVVLIARSLDGVRGEP